jgi:erythromycin esterase
MTNRSTSTLSDASLISLATLDPVAALDDLEPLKRLIDCDVRVVAVGESVHAAREFYLLRHRLVRFLVEQMSFTAVVWESGFPEGFLVDDYIQSRSHDRARVQREGFTMNLGRCDELGDFLDWLRAHNASAARPVRFYGLDLPGSSATIKPVLEVVIPYVESVDPGFQSRLNRLQELAALYAPAEEPAADDSKIVFAGTAAIRQYMSLSGEVRNELTALLGDLGARFNSLQRTYLERSDEAGYDFARQHLRVAVQLDLQLRAVAALMAGDASACEGNIRDATMADTVEWILEREERIIVLAHNGHIQKTPIATPTGTVGSVDTVGVHLARRLGGKYLTIGTTCGGGEIIAMRPVEGADGSYDSELYIRDLPPVEADTMDRLLDENVAGLALVDVRGGRPVSSSAFGAMKRMRSQDQVLEIDVRQAFDMLIHVPLIRRWTSSTNAMLPDERAAAK